jgi:WD40 repeat protein
VQPGGRLVATCVALLGDFVVFGCSDGTVRAWDYHESGSFASVAVVGMHGDSVSCCVASPPHAITAARDGSVHIFGMGIREYWLLRG